MRIVNKNINGRKMYYEQFNSYDEYWRLVENRDKTNAHKSNMKLENIVSTEGRSFVGVSSYAEAKELLINGWSAKVDQFKKDFEKEVEMLSDKKVVKNFDDVVGFMPIVPKAIMGLPNCMINNKTEVKKSRIIKFLILTSHACRYDDDDVLKQMGKVLARISILEKTGYRCRIEALQVFSRPNDSKTIVAHSVLLKSENQLFDIKRLAFPIAHNAFLRMFGFAWENSLPLPFEEYHDWGLGTGFEAWPEDKKTEFLNTVNENNEKLVVIDMKSNIEEIFGKEIANGKN